ncbi:YfcE family phosphodiesterase [Archaeoglobus veneficus]|uniref:Phosphoesterase n=1 Tax=Archaeoglobus veneficus (strain DSM 11195 / SNP6) TaxID=693661 RepID=F2KNM7_ARCVS|nr:YfcE family phosphodiesterase [Archaeoglobus veneficus]AEA46255.1 phosphodiesterase, MJ0936 family [Archaeoglobus veneficus SNP6]
MKVVAVSDTHMVEPESVLRKLDADLIIHAGDFVSYDVYSFLSQEYDVRAVHGNCDDAKLKKELPEVTVFEVEGVRFGVKHMPEMPDFMDIYYLARELEVEVMVFGHIHAFYLKRGKPTILCPGTLKSGVYAEIELPSLDIRRVEF